MSVTVAPEAPPIAVRLLIAVLGFLGVTAVGGGLAMLAGYTPPESWLEEIPVVDDWLVPGLVLTVVFGAGSLITAYGVLRRPAWRWTGPLERPTGHHWSWTAALLLGAGQLIWIALEVGYLPQRSVLQAVYGVTGMLLVLLPLPPAVRRHLASAR